ncbi:amidohydrolase family protein [Candidatus Laterigemmans baculatus]|uniref:amidohydrolase family protein n=1 Tax=Candidatus Laterigemmans baculatus TaxID=2770505 RepID=UPI0013DA8A81|nr:amidohydrolase family protein [Candidatus Laterigemmans baculatus]
MPAPTAHRLSRREFQSLALAGATALALPAASARALPAAEEAGSPGWIDAHVHVWTPDTDRYPISSNFKVSDMQPPSFTPEQLFAHCKPQGVDRIVLIQMSFYEFDNNYMLDTMAAHPGTFSGVGIVDSKAADVAAKIKTLASKGVRGLRIHPKPGEAAEWIRDEGMATLWKTARENGVAVCPLINPSDLPHVDAMCAKFPGTTVVVDHFARIGMTGEIDPDQLSALCRLARFPDAHVKTSAFYALGKKEPPYVDLLPMIRRLADTFGPDRLMWASDCPYQVQGEHTYAASIALIRDHADFLSSGDKQALLRNTAEKVFFA